MPSDFVFDRPHARSLERARGDLLRQILPQWKNELKLHSAIDLGCGVGGFAVLLRELGFEVTALEGRPKNAEEARRRVPGLNIHIANVEKISDSRLGSFDLTFCLGLLYHLENPFWVIRQLRTITRTLLVIESMCINDSVPVLHLRDEGQGEDQALRHIAFYPSEACVVKMLYCAGFPFVYRFRKLPDHPDFSSSYKKLRVRTMLAASTRALDSSYVTPVNEPATPSDPWMRTLGRTWQRSASLGANARRRFATAVPSLRQRINEQRSLMFLRWLRHVPAIPVLMRVPQVGWWLARNDACGQGIARDSYEKRERRFVEGVLRPGMTVLDIGAHHGLYTLLASRKVGPCGRVLAFEPSVRERNNLLKHLRLNRCRNVHVEAVALGSECGTGELFVVQGIETGCNSLRPPDVSEPTVKASVSLETLDGCLKRLGITEVDFVKIDAEGAELAVFKGAVELLKRLPRPIILAEVEDLRTAAWGYPALEIVDFLRQYDYRWFRLAECGLQLFEDDRARLDENLVAVPRERELPDFGSHVNIGLEAQSC